jgi:TonB-linked SusC/RagA family outer membrane protein
MRLMRVLLTSAVGLSVAGIAPQSALTQPSALASREQTWRGVPEVAASPLTQPAHLTVDQIPLEEALSELHSRSGVSFIFSPSLLRGKRKVTCSCSTATVAEALDRMLNGTGFVYSVFRQSVLIEPDTGPARVEQPQSRVINGFVTDSISGSPLEAGEVSVVGTSTKTQLRSDGSFAISAGRGVVSLSVRSIGYLARTVTVAAGQDTVRIGLARDYFRMTQVVITGQATGVEKRNLANSVATVDAASLSMVPASTIENQLQGKVAGAHISANSGAPGGGNVVRMRGVTSINGAFTPLYVVDGVIVSDANLGTGTNAVIKANGTSLDPQTGNEDNGDNRIADLNVNDIESVEVLRGASASAIYGSKAANGVIVITTKRGLAGAVKFDLTQRVGFSALDHEMGHRCFTTQAEAVSVWGAQAANTWTPTCNDWEKQLYGGTAGAHETIVSASGGTETTRYFASLLDSYDGGIVPNTGAGKKSLRINVDQRMGSKLDVSIGAEVIQTQRNPGVTQNGNNGTPLGGSIAYGGATWQDLRQQPNGSFPVNPFAVSNPFQTVAMFQNAENVSRNILSEKVTYSLYSSDRQKLQFISNGGVDMFTQKNFVLAPPQMFVQQAQPLPGASALSFGQSQNTNINANLVHVYNLPGGSTATSQIGVQYETQNLDVNHTLAQGLVGGLSNIDQGLAVSVQENRLLVHDMGIFAQEEFLALNERLLLTLGGRADQSSNNGDPKKLFFYPKASASYRIPVLPKHVEELKFRLAYGYSGNEPLYGQKFTELTAGNIAGSIPILAIQGNTGAADLRPERQREIETGFDATMLGGRLNLEVTVYEKTVTDLLLQEALAPTTGYASLFFNGGQMRNRGVELSVTAVPVETGAFTWRSTATYFMSRCLIQSLPVPAFRPATTINSSSFGYTFVEAGKSCTQVYGRDSLGTLPGDAALGVIGSVVQRAVSDDNPNFNVSWSNQLDYGRFHLHLLTDAQKGGILVNITQYEYDVTKDSPDYLVATHPGQLSGQQRAAWFAKSSRPYIQDASYLKLREINLSVDLPEAAVRRVWSGLRTARLEFGVRNLFTLSPYKSTADPEANQIPRSSVLGVPWDIWAYPPSRTFNFTIHFGT